MPTVVKIEGPMPDKEGDIAIGKSGVTAVEYERYLVTFDTRDINSTEACFVADGPGGLVPPFGYTLRNGYMLLGKKAKVSSDPFTWEVRCEYRLPEPGEEAKPDDGRTNWAIDINMRTVPYTYPLQWHYRQAADGSLNKYRLMTTAKELITDQTEEAYDAELTVAFTCTEIPFNDIFTLLSRRNKVISNSDVVPMTIKGTKYTFQSNTLRLVSFEFAATIASDAAVYPRVKLTMRVRGLVDEEDSWDRIVPNEGYRYLHDGKTLIYRPSGSTAEKALLDQDTGDLLNGGAWDENTMMPTIRVYAIQKPFLPLLEKISDDTPGGS